MGSWRAKNPPAICALSGLVTVMSLIEVLLIAIGLSMDAFAVSICKGLAMKKLNNAHALVIASFFAVFQAGMPLIGYLIGVKSQGLIDQFDHLIIFALLAGIGLKMIYDATHEEANADQPRSTEQPKLNIGELFLLAIATSLDALAVGITLAWLQVDIWSTISIIGVTTFGLSWLGVFLGYRFGRGLRKQAAICGGLILIGIGIKVVVQHYGCWT